MQRRPHRQAGRQAGAQQQRLPCLSPASTQMKYWAVNTTVGSWSPLSSAAAG